jgi:hypothetical protein
VKPPTKKNNINIKILKKTEESARMFRAGEGLRPARNYMRHKELRRAACYARKWRVERRELKEKKAQEQDKTGGIYFS